jgi:hypothetical protein
MVGSVTKFTFRYKAPFALILGFVTSLTIYK